MDDVLEQCTAIHARMKTQNLLGPWKEMTASLVRNGMEAVPSQKLAESLLCSNLLHANGEQPSDEVAWRWVLDNLTRATSAEGPDLLATAPSHKALAAVYMARTDPKFAQDLLMMDLKITRQRMERQNTKRFEDDGTDSLELIAKCRAGRKKVAA